MFSLFWQSTINISLLFNLWILKFTCVLRSGPILSLRISPKNNLKLSFDLCFLISSSNPVISPLSLTPINNLPPSLFKKATIFLIDDFIKLSSLLLLICLLYPKVSLNSTFLFSPSLIMSKILSSSVKLESLDENFLLSASIFFASFGL